MKNFAVVPEPTPIHASSTTYLIASRATACFSSSWVMRDSTRSRRALPRRAAERREADEKRAGCEPDDQIDGERDRLLDAAGGIRRGLDEVVQRRHAVHEDAAADEEHRGRAGDRQEPHEPRRGAQDARAERTLRPRGRAVPACGCTGTGPRRRA